MASGKILHLEEHSWFLQVNVVRIPCRCVVSSEESERRVKVLVLSKFLSSKPLTLENSHRLVEAEGRCVLRWGPRVPVVTKLFAIRFFAEHLDQC